MKTRTLRAIRFWQWPNVVSVDAALVAVLWQQVYAAAWDISPGLASVFVLGFSVWLTYAADRLLDAARRPYASLLSIRHQFAKYRMRPLVAIWLLVLLVDIAIAVCFLSPVQLRSGCILLAACLAYTALNQLLFRRFVPKELLVALIFTGGVGAFLFPLADPPRLHFLVSLLPFAATVFFNCIFIAGQEQRIDEAMGLRTVSALYSRHHRAMGLTGVVCLLVTIDSASPRPLVSALLLAQSSLLFLHWASRRLPSETSRVLADAIMLFAPLVVLLAGFF